MTERFYNHNSTAGRQRGYATEQFFNFSEYEEKGITNTPEDNPQFLYPGGTFPNIYDAPGTKQATPTKVQRGFIRGIYPDVLTSVSEKFKQKAYTESLPPIRRCFFQFNPSLILRSVQASSSTLNPLLQNPSELLQPIPGQASFEFQLLFNREREVSNQQYRNSAGNLAEASNLTAPLATYGGKGLEYAQQHVGDLGVFSDLYVLDSIIGQSITDDMVSSISSYWELTKGLRKTTTKDTKTDKDGNTTTTTTEENPWDSVQFLEEDFQKKLGLVLGNSAFLNPMPIRIVFSSLFMVEGFVTASNVAFHKFSAQMIPTVCTVTLNVQAMYIGFAKKNGYITEQLTQAIETDFLDKGSTEKAVADAKKLVYKGAYLQLNFMQGSMQLQGGDETILNDWFADITNPPTTVEAVGDKLYFQSRRHNSGVEEEGMYIWVDTPLAVQLKRGNITNLKPSSVRLILLESSKLPAHLNNTAAIKNAAETGTLATASSAALREYEAAKNEGRALPELKNYLIADLAIKTGINEDLVVDTDKIATSDKSTKLYELKWFSETLRTYGVGDDANALRQRTSYFGTSPMYVVLQVTWSYTVKGAGTQPSQSDNVTVASVGRLNPTNTQWLDCGTPNTVGGSALKKGLGSKWNIKVGGEEYAGK